MKKTIITISSLSIPGISFAQAGQDIDSLTRFLTDFFNKTLIPFFMLLGLAYTVFAVVKFIAAEPGTVEHEEKKQQIFWGLIGLAVLISIWGLVAIVGNTFGIFAGGNLQA